MQSKIHKIWNFFLVYILILLGFLMRSLTFDQGKMYIFGFQLTINLLKKKIYQTLYVMNAYIFQLYSVEIL